MSHGGKLVNDKLVDTCGQIAAFRRLCADECRQLLKIARERSFAPGEVVIEQGGRSPNLWILLEGKCEVVRDGEHDGPLSLAELEPQAVFGEMSFFSPAPHSASVLAKTHVRLLSIARGDYDELLAAGSPAAYKLAYNILGSVIDRLRRMDDWVAELAATDRNGNTPGERVPEWNEFRKKLFEGWM